MTDRTLRTLRTNRVPLAVRAQEDLLDLIESEVYRPGDKQLPETELTAQLGLTRPTPRDTLCDVEQNGFAVPKHGVGVPFAQDASLLLEGGLERTDTVVRASGGLQTEHQELAIEEALADGRSAEKLQVNLSTPLISIRRSLVIDGKGVTRVVDELFPEYLSDSDRYLGYRLCSGSATAETRTAARSPCHHHLGLQHTHLHHREASRRVSWAELVVEGMLFSRQRSAIGLSPNYFRLESRCFRAARRRRIGAACIESWRAAWTKAEK